MKKTKQDQEDQVFSYGYEVGFAMGFNEGYQSGLEDIKKILDDEIKKMEGK